MKKILLLAFTLATLVAMAQQDMPTEVVDARWMKANYTKAEYMIPMRDGVKLYTAVYAPKKKKSHHPILMLRTPNGCQPYGKKSVLLWEQEELHNYLRGEYILVFQDVRGRGMSEGEFVHMRPYIEHKHGSADIDESSDTYDTIEWLLRKLKRHNGNVGLYGCGYDGFYAVMGAASGHPAIKAVSPQAPAVDWFIGDMLHRNGALALMKALDFLPAFDSSEQTDEQGASGLLPARDDAWSYFLNSSIADITAKVGSASSFWRDMAAHPNYDEWWQQRSLVRVVKGLKAPLLRVGGSFDTENMGGTWSLYRAIRRDNPTLDCSLVLGPWTHGLWRTTDDANELGEVAFAEESLSAQFQNEIEFPFFERYLRGAVDGGLQTKSLIFFTGENCWREMGEWSDIPHDTICFYLGEEGALSFEKSNERNLFSSYLSDVKNPVPYHKEITISYKKEFANSSQNFVDNRGDILSFTSPVLEQDLMVAGEVTATLFAALSQSDADFVVKVIDVGPDGEYEQMVRADIIRGRYRKSLHEPMPFTPGQIEKVVLAMPDVAHTFMAGHRVKIQIQSSLFPLYDRNPQQFIDVKKAGLNDYLPCRVDIYHDAEHPSNISFRVMK